jgi:hypothetical protein
MLSMCTGLNSAYWSREYKLLEHINMTYLSNSSISRLEYRRLLLYGGLSESPYPPSPPLSDLLITHLSYTHIGCPTICGVVGVVEGIEVYKEKKGGINEEMSIEVMNRVPILASESKTDLEEGDYLLISTCPGQPDCVVITCPGHPLRIRVKAQDLLNAINNATNTGGSN